MNWFWIWLAVGLLGVAAWSVFLYMLAGRNEARRIADEVRACTQSVPQQPKPEPKFDNARISSVTFTVDRLPYLKNLLAAYEESEQKVYKERQQYAELVMVFQRFAQEVRSYLRDEYEQQRKDPSYFGDEGEFLRILVSYAGRLLAGLEDLRSKGRWDGHDMLKHDPYADAYRTNATSQLRSMVDALEAGGKEATLNIPAEHSGAYQTWFISSITYAIEQGKGPAAPKEKADASG